MSMDNYWGNLSLYSGMISASVVIGGIIPLFLSWIRRYLHLFLSVSAGLMLGATVIHLMPAAQELIGHEASLWTLAGFLFLYIFQKFLTVHLCEILECRVHKLGISAGIGICVHSLTDGIALGCGLLFEELGLVVFLTIFFHKLPEAFALTTILLHEAHSRAKIAVANVVLILMVPLGALLVRLVAGEGQTHLAGAALAFSAGTFLHVSLSDLLPHVHEHAERQAPLVVSFLIGLGGMFLLEWVLAHGMA